MNDCDNASAAHLVGPNGNILTIETLPAPQSRWVAHRKAELVAAIRGGLITLEEAERRYALTAEEFRSWTMAMERFGLNGLRSGHVKYRLAAG